MRVTTIDNIIKGPLKRNWWGNLHALLPSHCHLAWSPHFNLLTHTHTLWTLKDCSTSLLTRLLSPVESVMSFCSRFEYVILFSSVQVGSPTAPHQLRRKRDQCCTFQSLSDKRFGPYTNLWQAVLVLRMHRRNCSRCITVSSLCLTGSHLCLLPDSLSFNGLGSLLG